MRSKSSVNNLTDVVGERWKIRLRIVNCSLEIGFVVEVGRIVRHGVMGIGLMERLQSDYGFRKGRKSWPFYGLLRGMNDFNLGSTMVLTH